MLQVGIAKIRPDKEARLRAWFQELSQRTAEVLETFEREGTSHEQVFIIESGDGPILVYATEVDDKDKALAAFRRSTLSIDIEHRSVLTECLAEKLCLQPVFDLNAGTKDKGSHGPQHALGRDA